MNNDNVTAWKQAGNIFFWRYSEKDATNYPGWHLAADVSGFQALLRLLTAFKSGNPAAPLTRTIRLTAPTRKVLSIPNNIPARIVAPAKLRITVGSDSWIKTVGDAEVSIELNHIRLNSLLAWLGKPETAFDTMFGKEPPIWFWGSVE